MQWAFGVSCTGRTANGQGKHTATLSALSSTLSDISTDHMASWAILRLNRGQATIVDWVQAYFRSGKVFTAELSVWKSGFRVVYTRYVHEWCLKIYKDAECVHSPNKYALGSPSILGMEFHPSTFKLILMDVRLSVTMLVGVMPFALSHITEAHGEGCLLALLACPLSAAYLLWKKGESG